MRFKGFNKAISDSLSTQFLGSTLKLYKGTEPLNANIYGDGSSYSGDLLAEGYSMGVQSIDNSFSLLGVTKSEPSSISIPLANDSNTVLYLDGTNFTDQSSGGVATVTPTNIVSESGGHTDNAFRTTSTGSKFEVTFSPVLSGNYQTIEFWIKSDSKVVNGGVEGLFVIGYYEVRLEDDMSINVRDNNYSTDRVRSAPDAIQVNRWHHIAVVKDLDQAEGSIYLDGNLIGTHTRINEVYGATSSISIMRGYTNGRPYNGLMDQIRITNGVKRYESPFQIQDSLFVTQNGTATWFALVNEHTGATFIGDVGTYNQNTLLTMSNTNCQIGTDIEITDLSFTINITQ